MAVTDWTEDIDFDAWGSMPPNYGASATAPAGGTWNIPAYDSDGAISGALLTNTGRDGQPPLAAVILPLATGAEEVAGLEGFFTPSGATHRIPHNLNELIVEDLLADPVTLWTTASFVTLGDASIAHWDSTDWVVGASPV